MITSLKNYPTKYDFNQLIERKQNMPILTNNFQKTYNDEKVREEGDDGNSKLVSITSDSNQEQTFTAPTLRSILRKHVGKKVSTNTCSNAQQTSILINENCSNDERDSDYTGDEEGDEESNDRNIDISNEQHYHSFSRQQQKDQFLRTLPSTSSVSPLETSKTRTEPASFNENEHSRNRTACVTFTNDQPTIIHRSSSTPPFGGFNIEPRSSITYINVKEDLPTTVTTAMNSDFHPVYVSPLKYRPLLGLSANDSRLLLEKRVSLLGKPLVLHPIQKRSPAYRRNQLCIYNFLERANGYKALIYHTFV